MSRVLLVCPEPLGHQHPAGVGIRFLEFARALTAEGHQVSVLSPDGGKIPNCRCDRTTPTTITAFSREAHVAVVQGHIANELFVHGVRIPTVVDLYDPFLVENLHYFPSMGEEVFHHDHATLMRSLHQADFFLCASRDQRLFYLGALLAAQRINPQAFQEDRSVSQLIAVVPFGVPPKRTLPPRDLSAPAILFGGIYDWYEPTIAIEAVALARRDLPGISLTFTHHPNAEFTPQSKFAQAMRHVEDRGYEAFVHAEPWIPYQERSSFYDRFSAALITFGTSLETDLAMRTRVFDYWWAGLPVISSSAPGTDALLRQYNAGAVVESTDPREYAAALIRLLQNPADYAAKVRGTQAYTADYQWPKLLRPLLEFCRNPRIDATKRGGRWAGAEPYRPSIIGRLTRKLKG